MATSTYIGGVPPRPTVRGFYERLRGGDEIAYLATFASALAILFIVGLIVLELWIHLQATVTAFGWQFLISSTWDPNAGKFGALPFIYGTCITSFLALLIAVPLGVFSA